MHLGILYLHYQLYPLWHCCYLCQAYFLFPFESTYFTGMLIWHFLCLAHHCESKLFKNSFSLYSCPFFKHWCSLLCIRPLRHYIPIYNNLFQCNTYFSRLNWKRGRTNKDIRMSGKCKTDNVNIMFLEPVKLKQNSHWWNNELKVKTHVTGECFKECSNYSKLVLCKATRYVQNWSYLFGFCIDIAF